DLGLPAKGTLGLAGVTQQEIHLGRAQIARIELDVPLPVELHALEREIQEFPDRMSLARREHVVVALLLLEHLPHAVHVVASKAPIASRLEVAQKELVLQSQLDVCGRARDLARHERFAATRGLVIEQDTVGRMDAVGLAIVDRRVEGEGLGAGIRTTWVERRGLRLRNFSRLAVELRRRRLIEATVELGLANGFE